MTKKTEREQVTRYPDSDPDYEWVEETPTSLQKAIGHVRGGVQAAWHLGLVKYFGTICAENGRRKDLAL